MKRYRFWLLLPALIPLLLRAGYLLTAWRTSPLDRRDWVFLVAAGGAALLRHRAIRRWAGAADPRGWLPAAAALLLYALFIVRPIATLQIAAAMLFFFSMLWVTGGLRLFTGCLPLLGIGLLACPSTTYWSEFYLRALTNWTGADGFLFKVLAASALLLFFLLKRTPLRLRTVLFLAALALLGTVLASRSSRALYGDPLVPDLSALHVGEYVAVATDPTPHEQRFFAGSQLTKINYYGTHGEVIHLLSVDVTGSVHQVHPTELCLKSGRTVIRGVRERVIPLTDGRALAVQEIEAIYPDGSPYLIVTWYSGPDWSSGNFIAFRANWTRGQRWHSVQLMTAMPASREEAAARLDAFIRHVVPEHPPEIPPADSGDSR